MIKKFTLIELMVVAAIMGILLTLLLPALSRSRHVARFAVCKSRVSQISKALFLYSNSNSRRLPSLGNSRTKPKYHRYAWIRDNSGSLGKLVENNLISFDSLYCPEANESARNTEFKISEHLDSNGEFIPENNTGVVRNPYIFLPYKDKLKGVFVDSLAAGDFLTGSTFLSKNEVFHEMYGASWNVGLLNGAVETSRSKKAYLYLQSTYSGDQWSKAEFMRESLLPE